MVHQTLIKSRFVQLLKRAQDCQSVPCPGVPRSAINAYFRDLKMSPNGQFIYSTRPMQSEQYLVRWRVHPDGTLDCPAIGGGHDGGQILEPAIPNIKGMAMISNNKMAVLTSTKVITVDLTPTVNCKKYGRGVLTSQASKCHCLQAR